MKFRLSILCALLLFQSCDSKKITISDLKQKQNEIDSLWTNEITDTLQTNKYYLKNFGITQQGQTIRLDNLKIDNWPNTLISFHDILLDPLNKSIASQDWVADSHEGSCLSRHYFNNNGQSFARLISNYYYDDSIGTMVDDKTYEYFDTDNRSLGQEYYLADDKQNRIVKQVGRPKLDGHQFPFYKNYTEFVASNKIAQ
jgi:hypothetical protein